MLLFYDEQSAFPSDQELRPSLLQIRNRGCRTDPFCRNRNVIFAEASLPLAQVQDPLLGEFDQRRGRRATEDGGGGGLAEAEADHGPAAMVRCVGRS